VSRKRPTAAETAEDDVAGDAARVEASGESPGEASEESPSKAELRRQMEAARESISDTVAEIKSVVAHQYEEVRETVETVRAEVGEVLDWRTEFERNPLVWGAGAVSIGMLIGFGIAHAFDDEEKPARGKKRRGTTGGHIVAELSGLADVVLPTISSKVKELFGLDLDAYLRAAHERRHERALSSEKEGGPKGKAARGASKKGETKKGAAKKGASKKGAPKARRVASKRGAR
jgi:hypothetical protein